MGDKENVVEGSCLLQESEALELYNKGLALQQRGDYSAAEEAYDKLLNSALVKEVTHSCINALLSFYLRRLLYTSRVAPSWSPMRPKIQF